MPNPMGRLWMQWKSLRLPWRRQRLAGADLEGNTYWEFQDALNSNRFRRIVRYNKHTLYADVKIPPQWHQWLRHTRSVPPTEQEQQLELVRRANMKQLAQRADERWASIPSFLSAPTTSQPSPATIVSDPAGLFSQTHLDVKQHVRTAIGDDVEVQQSVDRQPKDDGTYEPHVSAAPSDPWTSHPPSRASGEEPQSWTPGVASRR